MEYLELPLDIIWDGNQSQMLSPSHLSNASTEQVLIFEDNFANELIPNDDDLMKPNQEAFVFSPDEFDFQQLLDIQQELESLDNMDEEVQNDQWLDQPINVPVDEYVPVQDARICPVKGNTAQLLNEFNQVYDAVELTHLTPPETPPHSPPQPLQVYLNQSKNQFYSPANTNYQQANQQQCQTFKTVSEKPMPVAYAPSQPSVATQQFPSILEQAIHLVQQAAPIEYVDNIEDAMAEVEALVRSRAEDFADNSIDDDSSICDSSTCFSPRSDASSSSPRSESSSTMDDSDWTQKSSLAIGAALKAKQAKQKRRPRKNRRSLEDRQSRKKEQNKTAANRYRLKKKAEIEILLDEERELQTVNDKLQKQYDEVSREASYIKRLLRVAFEAKGIL